MSTLRIVVLAAAGLLVLSGTAFGLTEALRQEERVRTIVRDPVKRIEIHADHGDVDVRAGLTPAVVVDRRDAWLTSRPSVRVRVQGDTLMIDARCDGATAFLRCSSDLSLAVPSEIDVAIRGGSGDVDLRGLRGRADIETDAGDIRTHRLEPVTLHATTKAGDVDLDVFGQPARVAAFSEAGDVSIVVPYGAYRVQAETDDGEARVAGLLRDDLAPQRIEAVTDAGDVSVRAR